MEESFLFFLLSYALTPALSQWERELPTRGLAERNREIALFLFSESAELS